jgi:transcriptional regulator with XRE-family HTH domain
MMLTTGAQLRAARALLRLEQEELAREANLSVETIRRLERRNGRIDDARIGTLNVITAAFAARGVTFTNGERPGVAVELAKLNAA